jgi:hypothetical protein
VATPLHVQLSGTGFLNYLHGFDQVNAYANAGGFDLALMYDSVGNDQFTGLATYSQLSGAGFLNYVSSFEQVNAYSTQGGSDSAQLISNPGDSLTLGNGFAQLSNAAFLVYMASFESLIS